MSTLTPLVTKAQPAVRGGGCRAAATEGRNWSWAFTVTVDSVPLDLSSGVTGTCTVWDAATGASVVSLDVACGNGTVTVSKAKALTAGLAGGAQQGRQCRWSLSLDDGTTSVELWMPNNSAFTIYDESWVAS